ncbi:hypothetical protein KSS87_007891 [Heliosperma pusillum]|nr:hypothetical protein KSS87_007891 [Heliosperma pusillum]
MTALPTILRAALLDQGLKEVLMMHVAFFMLLLLLRLHYFWKGCRCLFFLLLAVCSL